MTTSDLDIFICIEDGIHRYQQSTYDNCGSIGSHQQKGRTGHTFVQKRQGGTHGGTKENSTLVPGRDRTTLNATCYNYRRTVRLAYSCSDTGCTGTWSLKVIHIFARNKIQKNEQINDNWVVLDLWSWAIVLKIHIWRKIYKNVMQRRNC